MTIETPEQITAAEIISKIKPFDRIDADLVIVLRDRLISKTGCSWETARQCILEELLKREGTPKPISEGNHLPLSSRPKSNTDWLASTLAIRGTPDEVRGVRRMIPSSRKRLTILLDWLSEQQ